MRSKKKDCWIKEENTFVKNEDLIPVFFLSKTKIRILDIKTDLKSIDMPAGG